MQFWVVGRASRLCYFGLAHLDSYKWATLNSNSLPYSAGDCITQPRREWSVTTPGLLRGRGETHDGSRGLDSRVSGNVLLLSSPPEADGLLSGFDRSVTRASKALQASDSEIAVVRFDKDTLVSPRIAARSVRSEIIYRN